MPHNALADGGPSSDTCQVITLTPAVETYGIDDFDLWPIGDEPSDGCLPLRAGMTFRHLGTALAVLVRSNQVEEEDGDEPGPLPGTSPAAALRRLLACDGLIAPGGLQVHDTATGATIAPGCCFGLEDWREWLRLAEGEVIWLGHSPDIHAEHHGPLLRLWLGSASTVPERVIEFPRARLGGLLASVRQDLNGFLADAGDWAEAQAPGLGAAVTARLDAEFTITAPLATVPG